MNETQNRINEIRSEIEGDTDRVFVVSPVGVQTVTHRVFVSDMDLDTLRFEDEDDEDSFLFVTMVGTDEEMCLEI